MNLDKFSLPPRYEDRMSVWTEYGNLSAEHKPVPFGIGAPNIPPSDIIKQALVEVSQSDSPHIHEHTRKYGHPRLVKALAELYGKILCREIDPYREIVITCGGWGSITYTLLGFVHPGDEVIIIEPAFDCYAPLVRQAGGVVRFITLMPKESQYCNRSTSEDWCLNREEMEGLFNNKTKVLIFNNPHNPIGKVFDIEEMEWIADLCKKWDVLILADEVYEWVVYSPTRFVRMSSLPDMWERTVTIGSAGKTFGITGWKTGWAYGASQNIKRLQIMCEINLNSYCTPIQEAIAIIIERELDKIDSSDSYIVNMSNMYKQKRDFMTKCLVDIGMRPVVPQGGYFILADWSPLENKVDLSSEPDEALDFKFTKWMIKNVKVGTIPPSTFISETNKPYFQNYIRVCYTKTDDTLQEGIKLLREWRKTLL